jgi:metal-responsive CopG/Arc/MetJ family transcriptional regulator
MQYMTTTQVTLPEDLLRDIRLQAKREQKDEDEIIRELLRVGLTNKRRQTKVSTGASLLRLAEVEGTGPSDLSTRADDYLYGDK